MNMWICEQHGLTNYQCCGLSSIAAIIDDDTDKKINDYYTASNTLIVENNIEEANRQKGFMELIGLRVLNIKLKKENEDLKIKLKKVSKKLKKLKKERDYGDL